jgi:hypothetical protein
MSTAEQLDGFDFEDAAEANYVADALAKDGIQTEVIDLDRTLEPPPASSKMCKRLLVRPEDGGRTRELITELRIFQYLKGWGKDYPGYELPLAEFAAEVKTLRIQHSLHNGLLLVLISLALLCFALEALFSVPELVQKLLGGLTFLTALVTILSAVSTGQTVCPRCQKQFHHHRFLYTIFETQCLNCGFHLWNKDGI